jgi:hypothetical protein
VLQVPDNARGKKVRCGKCGRNFRVPDPDGSAQKKEPNKAEIVDE